MNDTEKKIVLMAAIASTVGYFYMQSAKKKGSAVSIIGLDADNSIKLVGSLALITVAMTAYCKIIKPMLAK